MGPEIVLEIVKNILIFGPGAVRTIAEAMDNSGDDLTQADIESLFILKDPAEYF